MPENPSATRHGRKTVGIVTPINSATETTSTEYEQSLLGGILLNNTAWPDVSRLIEERDFSHHSHRLIFRAITDLFERKRAADLVTLADALEQTGVLQEAGDWAYLGLLVRDTPSAVNAREYARIVRRKSLERRRLAAIAKGDHHQAAAITAAIDALESSNGGAALLADYVSVESLDGQSFTRTYLIEGLIEQGRVYEFFGKYKDGKTLTVIDVAANLSIGHPWANRRTAPTLVVWVAGEAVDDVKMRIEAWRLRHDIKDPMPFYIRVKPVYMTEQEFAARLAKEIEEIRKQHPGLPVLLVLDTVARCMKPGTDENSIMGLGAFINNLLDIVVRPLQATAICVHHSGYGDSDRSRGHSSFPAAVDGSIKVCTNRGSGQPVITVAPVTSRSTAGDDSFSFRVEVQGLSGQDNFGNPIDAPVLRYLADFQPVAAVPTGKHEKAAYAILQQQGPMLTGDWRKAFDGALKQSEPNYDTRKKSWRRARAALLGKGLVIEQNNTASLARGDKGDMSPLCPPLSPDISKGGHGDKGDTLLKECPLVPPPVPVPVPGDRAEQSTEQRVELPAADDSASLVESEPFILNDDIASLPGQTGQSRQIPSIQVDNLPQRITGLC